RTELWRSTRGKTLARLNEPLGDELPRAKEISALLEHDRHRREPEARHAADLLDAGETAHRSLDRERDGALDVDRTERRHSRQHLHLDVGDVGYGVDRQLQRAAYAHRRDDDDKGEDEESPLKTKFEKLLHGESLSARGLRRARRCVERSSV